MLKSLALDLFVLVALLQTVTSMSLRHRLLNGGRSYGPLLLSDSPTVAELLASVGYDHLVIDHEHCGTDVRSGQTMLRAMQAAAAAPGRPRTEPIVRLPGPNDPVYMKKVLDSLPLPGGVLVPMVENAAMAEAVVASTRYPQRIGDCLNNGVRGCAAPFVRASGYGFDTDYLDKCNSDLLVMVQVETKSAVENIEAIANVDGVDAIFIGPLDLSTSIGKMGQFDHPEVADLLSRAEEAVRQSPALLAGFRSPGRSIADMFECGYSFLCGSVDLGLLKLAAQEDLRDAKKALKRLNKNDK